MKWMLFALLAMTIAGGCIAPQEAKNLTFENVHKSTEFGVDLPYGRGKIPFFQRGLTESKDFAYLYSSPPAYAVILERSEWDYLFTPYAYKPPPPSIDFSTEFLIAYGFVYPTGGATVEILNVTQSASTIHIIVADHLPEGPVTLAVTYPLHIIKIKKSELLQRGNLTFIFTDVNGTQLRNVTRFVR